MIEDDPLYVLINNGRLGKNIGLTTGIPKLDEDISGIQKSTIYIIAGTTGSGKTSFALYSFIYAPLKEHLESGKYKIVYFSLEMSREMLEAKLLSLYIFETYGVPLTYNQILSRQEILSDDAYKLLLEARDWIEKVRKVLIIHDVGQTVQKMATTIAEYAKNNGTFEPIDGTEDYKYIPNDDTTHLMIVDHLGLMNAGTGSKKVVIDATSKMLLEFRKQCGFSSLMLMQVNRGASGMDRRTNQMQELELGDLKESGDPAEASDVVIALFNPLREKMTTYRGYPVRELRDKLRSAIILKSRFGVSEQGTALNFHGNIGLFKEMPPADNISDYSPYLRLGFKENEINEQQSNKGKEEFSFSL